MVHADDGDGAACRHVAKQVHAVDVNEVESLRSQDIDQPPAILTRIVQVGRIGLPQRRASKVIPYESESAVSLRDGKDLYGSEPGQRIAARRDVSPCPVAGARRPFEAERRDFERARQETQDMVRPDPHAAIRRVRQGLAEEEEPWTHGQRPGRADARLVSSRMTLLEKPRRAQNRARSVRPLRSRSICSAASATGYRTLPGG